MTSPQIDSEEMRTLAARMARESAGARRALARFLSGHVPAVDAVPVMRREATALLFPTDKAAKQISKPLRNALALWVAAHSRTDEPKRGKVIGQRYYLDEVAVIAAAAELAGVDQSTYVRQAALMAADRDLKAAEQGEG